MILLWILLYVYLSPSFQGCLGSFLYKALFLLFFNLFLEMNTLAWGIKSLLFDILNFCLWDMLVGQESLFETRPLLQAVNQKKLQQDKECS